MEAETRKPVSGTSIRILDSDIGGDDLLASGITESDGRFSIKWSAKKTVRGCKVRRKR